MCICESSSLNLKSPNETFHHSLKYVTICFFLKIVINRPIQNNCRTSSKLEVKTASGKKV